MKPVSKSKRNFVDIIKHLFVPQETNNYRPRVLHPEALAVILGVSTMLLLVGGLAIKATHPLGMILGYASDINTSQVIAFTNQQRQAIGLAPLVYNSKLALAAQAKANDMFTNQYWSHTSPSGLDPWYFIESSGYKYRIAGENLARDFARTPEMVQAWMDSPTHRANIINSKYEEIGVAVVDGVLNGVETTLVVQMFGKPSTSKPALVQAPPAQAIEAPVLETEPLPTVDLPQGNYKPSVLSQYHVEQYYNPYSPKQIAKALFLSMILLLIITLIYDLYAIGHNHSLRLVGKNLAHIIFLGAIAFIVIFYKSGTII